MMGAGQGPTLLPAGRSLTDNLATLRERFPVTTGGYFGKKGEGGSATRNIESSDPFRTAWEFAHLAAYSPMGTTTNPGKGLIWTMRDGSVVSYRYFSSSRDKSPVVELKIKGASGVRSQKIHFVKKGVER